MAIIFDAEPSTIQITADAEVVPKGYADLVDRVEALEDGAVDETVIAQAVTDYLDEYGVTVTTDDTLDTSSTNPIQNAPVATAIETILNDLSVGGKNYFVNVNIPDVSSTSTYPRLIEQPVDTTTSTGTVTATNHGLKVTNTSAVYPYITFGGASSATATLNGLEAGKTYTISFNWSAKLCSGTGYTAGTAVNLRLYVYYYVSGTAYNFNDLIHQWTTASTETSGFYSYTFTLPSDATAFRIYIAPAQTTASYYASGDYLALDYLTLEEGEETTSFASLASEIDAKADATVTRTDTTSAETATSGGTVDVVDSVTTNTAGQVTGVNVKTVTLPDSTAVSVTQTLTEGTEIASIDVDGTETVLYAPSGSSETWELIADVSFTEEVATVNISTDTDGNAFELKKALVLVSLPAYTGSSTVATYAFSQVNGIYAGTYQPAIYTNFVAPSTSQTRSMKWLVDVGSDGKPYHEELWKTNTSGSTRKIGWSGLASVSLVYDIVDGTEPTYATGTITSVGAVNGLFYEGCTFKVYGVRA